MSFSLLPLSYCTNVHAGRSVRDVEAGLDRYTVSVRDALGSPLAAGLWLARPVVQELTASAKALETFANGLENRGLTCHTLNAFPYGDFHSERVKENVYLPDWSHPDRLTYTQQCAKVLAALLAPDAADGSISTVPLGFKGFDHPTGFIDDCISQLIELSVFLDDLRRKTGKMIRLAIEPEPLCVLETTSEAIEFFRRLWRVADDVGAGEVVRMHLGLCYDVCHQAVEFEEVGASIAALDAAGIRINKLHISCALQLDDPSSNAAGCAALRNYVEPRYLHQTTARTSYGDVSRIVDLTDELITAPPREFSDVRSWRIHFHVPVDAENLGPLKTTRPSLRDALVAVKKLGYAPHLEVETYTWEVLPGRGATDLVQGLTRELKATRELIAGV